MSNDRFRRLFKEGSWIATGQLVSVAGSLVLVRVLTDYLDPSSYGELALGLTIGGLVNQVVTGGVGAGISRYYSIATEKFCLTPYLRASSILMGWALLGIMVIGIILIVGLIGTGHAELISLTVVVLLFSILSGFNSSLSGIQNAARQRHIVALHSAMDAWLKIGLTLAVIPWLGRTGTAVVIGYVLSAIVITTSQLFFMSRLVCSVQFSHSEASGTGDNWIAEIWKFSWPFSVWGIFTWMQQASDRWALQFFSSTDDVGAYTVLYQLGFVPISLATGLLVSLVSPILFQRVGDATEHARVQAVYDMTRKIAILVMVVTVVCAIFVRVFHDLIFQLLTNERYHAVSHLMPWFVIAGGFQACHHILGMRITATLQVQSIVAPQILSALVFVMCNLVGAYYGGLRGLVYGFVFASLLYLSWMLVFSEILLRRATTSHTLVENLK